MRTTKWIAAMAAGSVILMGPATTFAATADISEEEVKEALDESLNMPIIDGMGGGYMPSPYQQGGVMVDASITKEVTPDYVAINAYCDIGKKATREQAREAAKKADAQAYEAFTYAEIKAAVGTDGRVRKMGGISVYPYYNPTGEESGSFTSNLSVFVRFVNMSAVQRVTTVIEDKGCSVNWDVRLVDMQSFELSVLDDLSTRLNKRKAVFEKLLGKKLTTITSASLSTWVDGYSSYDPETNKADATTTLNITFNLGKATTPAASTPTTRSRVPRG